MFQARDQDTRARDSQTKYIQSTVANVEKHFGDLCSLFAAYTRKTARLRDKSDLLVKELREYADTETPHLKYGLSSFADHFALIQDYRHAEVERLEAKVVEPLKKYGSITKLKRAENELQRVTMDATRISRQLEETIDDFQEEKIKDIKKIFGDLITIEMAFHAKALEVYSNAYQHVQNIDEEADMEQQVCRIKKAEDDDSDDEEEEDDDEDEEDEEDEENYRRS
ncbi:CBY1-interacting BAR domain-containing protein 1 isoform X2 [Mobula birostris]|uniref:CBY1-interacting BAR domain-containing protein 1 isoform X2 n=1 Tax=Mobula birostris TaxID=1983395 RepID=UPI003B287AC7